MFPNRFQTARLILRPISPADADPIFEAYAQDAEVTRFLTWRPHRSVEETRAYIASCLGKAAAQTYVLINRTEETLHGAFDLRQSGSNRLGFGYVLSRTSWGRGLMTEALTAVTLWALEQPNIWRIGSVCDIENHASARVMEKSGLSREGILRRWLVHPNLGQEPRDCISFAKVR